MTVEILALLHAKGVDLASTGHHEEALKLFRQMLPELRRFELGTLDAPRSAPPAEQESVLRLFPIEEDTLGGSSSDERSRLFPLLSVLVEEDRYQDLSSQDMTLFTAATLFNVGRCYQIQFLQKPRSNVLRYAERIYRAAIDIVRAFLPPATLAPSLAMLGAALCNNLAAIYAESFERRLLLECVDAMESYMQNVGGSLPRLRANRLSWRSIETQHAGVA